MKLLVRIPWGVVAGFQDGGVLRLGMSFTSWSSCLAQDDRVV
jgi:hypothetical protein